MNKRQAKKECYKQDNVYQTYNKERKNKREEHEVCLALIRKNYIKMLGNHGYPNRFRIRQWLKNVREVDEVSI